MKKILIPALVILGIACCVASSCTSSNTIEQIDTAALARVDSAIIELDKKKDTIEKLAAQPANPYISLDSTVKLIRLMGETRELENKERDLWEAYLISREHLDYVKYRKAHKIYTAKWNEYENFRKKICSITSPQ